jgi:hypothetical protein
MQWDGKYRQAAPQKVCTPAVLFQMILAGNSALLVLKALSFVTVRMALLTSFLLVSLHKMHPVGVSCRNFWDLMESLCRAHIAGVSGNGEIVCPVFQDFARLWVDTAGRNFCVPRVEEISGHTGGRVGLSGFLGRACQAYFLF